MTDVPTSENSPPSKGKCVECGRTYPMEVTDDGDLVPIGMKDVCVCGNDTFELRPDE